MAQLPELEIIRLLDDRHATEPPMQTLPWRILVTGGVIGVIAILGLISILSPPAETDAWVDEISESTFSDVVRTVGPGEPFFADETGWDLLIGAGGTTMTRVRIDSGRFEAFNNHVAPILNLEQTVIVGGSNYFQSVSPGPNVEPLSLLGGTLPRAGVIAGPQDGQIWLNGASADKVTWQLWQLGELPRMLHEVSAPGNSFVSSPIHPLISSAPSGGVFAGSEETLQRVADGRLLAVTPSHAVVQQCDSPFDCAINWLSLATWQVDANIRSPEILDHLLGFTLLASPDGERVVVVDPSSGTSSVWNLKTGLADFVGLRKGAAFSPDSRYLAATTDQNLLVLVDLETGDTVRSVGKRFFRYAQIAFIPAS